MAAKKCWPGYKKQGTKMGKSGIVNNCVKIAKTGRKIVKAGGENHVVYKSAKNYTKGTKGDIMVNHPTMDKGKWDTINLTRIGKAKTIKQGVASTKKWHKDNPDYKYKGKGSGKK